jgi:signal transduction histidine kinase/ActR/RegA family two-component response regulator
LGINAFACQPLLAADKLVGALSFGVTTRPNFTGDELNLMRTVCDQVAIALDRSNTEIGRMRAIAELEKARAEAENANRAKSAFLANMSHEIRTPLGAIMGFGELLKDHSTGAEESAQFIDTIIRNGQELTRLIDDILDLSKVEAGKVDLEKIPIDVGSFMESISNSLAPRAKQKGISLDINIAPGLKTAVTDPTRLRQVLTNIVDNAIKFTAKGSVTVSARLIPGFHKSSLLQFAVKDTGIGLTRTEQARLFQPFSQADSSTTRRYGGTGLGLALAQKLAKALGGEIFIAETAPGKGSTFIVNVDSGLKEDENDSLSPAVRLNVVARVGQSDLAGLNILVAEDAIDNQELIRRILHRAGAMVDLVGNGAEAVERALAYSYDLVLMDIQMPIMDGFDATKELRKRGFGQPIIALTAHAMREQVDQCLRAGCDDHLSKPLSVDGLLKIVAFYTGRAESSA